MDEHEERIRGAEAEQLLKNPLLVEALATIEANVINQLALPDITPEKAQQFRSLLVSKRALERYLAQIVTTGKMASLVAEEKRQRNWFQRSA